MRDINLSQENLAVQWQYVKRNLREMGVAANFDDFEQKAHTAIEDLIQKGIYEEFTEQVGAGRYEHAPSRLDERKGKYPRFLTTTFGASEVMVPRTRDGLRIRYSLFDRYQRRQKKFDNMILFSMILGLSERKQRKFFKAL